MGEINGVYRTGSPIKLKNSLLRSSLYDYGVRYILFKGSIMVPNTETAGANPNNIDKNVICKNCAPFIDCISEINNTEIYHVKDMDIRIPMYNLMKYSDNYSKIFRSLWPYHRDEPTVNDNKVIGDFPDHSDSTSFQLEQKVTGQAKMMERNMLK